MAPITSLGALLAAAFAMTSTTAFAECFSMYDAKNALVYESWMSPIDLSRSITEEMRSRFPARYLVISTTASCPYDAASAPTSSRFSGTGDFAGASTSQAADRNVRSNPYDAPSRARSRRR